MFLSMIMSLLIWQIGMGLLHRGCYFSHTRKGRFCLQSWCFSCWFFGQDPLIGEVYMCTCVVPRWIRFQITSPMMRMRWAGSVGCARYADQLPRCQVRSNWGPTLLYMYVCTSIQNIKGQAIFNLIQWCGIYSTVLSPYRLGGSERVHWFSDAISGKVEL